MIKTALQRSSTKTLDRLFVKCRKIVGHFRHSCLATEALTAQQKISGMKPLKKLIQDVPTRWNSGFYMLKRLVELQAPLSVVLSKDKDGKSCNLSKSEWTAAESLVRVLSDLEVVTATLSGEQYVTLS